MYLDERPGVLIEFAAGAGSRRGAGRFFLHFGLHDRKWIAFFYFQAESG